MHPGVSKRAAMPRGLGRRRERWADDDELDSLSKSTRRGMPDECRSRGSDVQPVSSTALA